MTEPFSGREGAAASANRKFLLRRGLRVTLPDRRNQPGARRFKLDFVTDRVWLVYFTGTGRSFLNTLYHD